jgi:hypothetical protein
MKTYLHKLRHRNANGATAREPRQRGATAASFINQMDPAVQASFTPHQQAEIARVIDLAIAKPTPKLVDLRFEIDLLISRFFIVLMVGKDRRRAPRNIAVSRAHPVRQLAGRCAADRRVQPSPQQQRLDVCLSVEIGPGHKSPTRALPRLR